MSLISPQWKYIPVMSLAVLLSGCLDSNDATTAATISGTAATGAPIIGGAVTVDCASGNNLTTTTSNTGAWSVTISGQTAPCAVQVVTTGGDSYFSFAPAIGSVANVTPLTSLIVANLSGEDPAAWFGGLNPARFAAFDSTAEIDAAVTAVTAALGLNTALGSNNPVRTAFSATNGNIIDDVLEAFQAALAGAGTNFATLLADARNATITPPAGFNSAFTIAFGTLPSGGGGGGGACDAGATATTYSGTAAAPYTNGGSACFTATSTSLAFSGKTLSNPVAGPVGNYTIVTFTDADTGYKYETVLVTASGALYEINLLSSNQAFLGQFAPAAAGGGGGGGGAGSLSVTTSGSIMGVSYSIPAITISPVSAPANQTEFCGGITNDASYQQVLNSVGAGGLATLTFNSCSYSGNVGTISMTISINSIAGQITGPYTITYTFN